LARFLLSNCRLPRDFKLLRIVLHPGQSRRGLKWVVQPHPQIAIEEQLLPQQSKTEGQPAHTREAKLGCVFTQTTWDNEGYAIRDPDSTTYVGAIETAGEFGKRIYLEAWKRGWPRAEKKVFMGDGKIEDLVAALRAINSPNPELADKIRIEAGYFENNTERMRYPKFRSQHLFVGTGVIEAGCKAPIGSRCKQSGMRHARKRVLDRARRQRDPGFTPLPVQRPV
jgi:hypothetical protein